MTTTSDTISNTSTTMNGGFGFANKGIFFKNKSKYKFKNVVKNTKKSEVNLMNAYEDMDSKVKKYNKAYAIHLENIKILDDYLNFNGIETLFKKVIMLDNFINGRIDKSNPLLFNNYKVKGELLPSEMRKTHLLTQVTYIISKSISGSDQTFIKDTYVTDISKKEFVLVVITIDNIKDKKIIPHSDYLVDKTKVKEFIKNVISDTKKKLQRTSKIAYFNGTNHSIKLSKNIKVKSAEKRNISKKSKKNSNNFLLISNKKSRNDKSKSYHSRKSGITSKLTEFMTDFEKIKKADKIKEQKQKAEAEAKAKQYAAAQKINNKKGGILGQDYGQQIKPGYQEPYQMDELDVKCRAIGFDNQKCDELPGCYFDRNKGCKKNNPAFVRNPNPYPRNPYPRNPYPPPNIGASPIQNPFNVQQQNQAPIQLI